MRATDFEFRFRFLIIVGILLLGFACSFVDPVGTAGELAGVAQRLGAGVVSRRILVRAVFFVGGAVVAFGAGLRTWASAYLRADVVHDRALHAGTLVADGPYRRLRHPLYLGVWLLAAGIGVAMSRIGTAFVLAAISLYLVRLIRREEAELARTQGEPYAAYRRAVPSFLPAFRPRVAAGGARPRWAQAVKGELFAWFYALALLAYAFTGEPRWSIGFAVAGFVVNAWEVHGAPRRL